MDRRLPAAPSDTPSARSRSAAACSAPDVIIFATWFLGKARCCIGDYGGALALLEDAYELCDRIGDRAWKSRLLNTLGWCFAEIGGVERAREYNERAAVLAREIGDPEILANADINLAAQPPRARRRRARRGAARADRSRRSRGRAIRGCAGATRCTSATRAAASSWRAARRTSRSPPPSRARRRPPPSRPQGRGAAPSPCAAPRCSRSSAATTPRRACRAALAVAERIGYRARPAGARIGCWPSWRGAPAAAPSAPRDARRRRPRRGGACADSLQDDGLRRALAASVEGE